MIIMDMGVHLGVTKSYIDYLNAWYEDDWTLFKDYDSWEKGAREIIYEMVWLVWYLG